MTRDPNLAVRQGRLSLMVGLVLFGGRTMHNPRIEWAGLTQNPKRIYWVDRVTKSDPLRCPFESRDSENLDKNNPNNFIGF